MYTILYILLIIIIIHIGSLNINDPFQKGNFKKGRDAAKKNKFSCYIENYGCYTCHIMMIYYTISL